MAETDISLTSKISSYDTRLVFSVKWVRHDTDHTSTILNELKN